MIQTQLTQNEKTSCQTNSLSATRQGSVLDMNQREKHYHISQYFNDNFKFESLNVLYQSFE
jgi:hypothetical protein